MVRLVLLFISIAALAIFEACGPKPIPCIRVSSTTTTETRDIKDFNGVIVYVEANVKIRQGSEYEIKLTGPDNVVELIETSLTNEYLVISTSDCFNGDYELFIEITAPVYELVNLNEKSLLETNGTIEGTNIQLELLGNVEVNVALEMDSIFTSYVGKGDLNFSGSSIYHSMILEGEFDVSGFELMTDYSSIDLIGIGNCEVYANEKLDVSITGIGDVYYKGTPDISSMITGTGQIINAN